MAVNNKEYSQPPGEEQKMEVEDNVETLQQEDVADNNSNNMHEHAIEDNSELSEDHEPISPEFEQLRKESEENYQRLLRVQADYDNFRRRTKQEKEDFAKYASAKLITQLLPSIDNLERALSSSKQTQDFEALVKGIDMVYRQFFEALSQEGLNIMEAVGQPFDPELHQAVMQVESDDYEEGIVVEELQKGYLLKDKVIRPAMVKVSQ